MRILLIIAASILSACSVVDIEHSTTQASYYMVNDRSTGKVNFFILSSDKRVEDFVIDADKVRPYPMSRQVFTGSFYTQNGKVMAVTTNVIGYEEFTFVKRPITTIKVLEDLGSLLYVETSGDRTMMAKGKVIWTLEVGMTHEVVVDWNQDIPVIEAVI